MSSLHKWFKGSRSKDGKPGWVNVVTGGTCASDEPGEGTPKCVSSEKRASMTKAERLSASRRKKVADPNQQQKTGASKPTYVSTDKKKKKMNEQKKYPDHEHSMIRSELQTIMKAVKRLEKKMKGEGNVEAWVQSKITKAADYIDSAADYIDSGEHNVHGSMDEQKDIKGKGSGKKDACYTKVKSRYSVWPSAYASGALVKCRKVGAANWGNKTENYEFSNWRDEFEAMEYQFIDLITPEPLLGEVIDEKCWQGYTQKGMKKKGKKIVPNCVPVGEQKHTPTKSDLESNIGGGNLKKLSTKAAKRIDYDVDGDVDARDKVEKKTGEYGEELPTPFGKFRTGTSKNVKVKNEEFYDWRSELNEDWQKVNKSDKTDGMSPAAVKAYRRENPGSKLKTAVTGDPKPGSKDSKRRKSFCSRSEGQQDMHDIDCSKTPDKPICKARRRWKC